MKLGEARFVLLTFAVLLCIPLTWFGLMSSAWTEAGRDNPIDVSLLWILPLLSLPLVVAYWAWAKMPPLEMWALALSEFASASWLNWTECLRRGCTTSNPVLITLSGVVFFSVPFRVAIAILCQCEFALRDRA